MSELRRCLIRANIRKRPGLTGKPIGKLTLVGKPSPPPTPVESFHDAAASIVDFAQRWRDGKASLSEIENADVMLLDMRRLLAEQKRDVEVHA